MYFIPDGNMQHPLRESAPCSPMRVLIDEKKSSPAFCIENTCDSDMSCSTNIRHQPVTSQKYKTPKNRPAWFVKRSELFTSRVPLLCDLKTVHKPWLWNIRKHSFLLSSEAHERNVGDLPVSASVATAECTRDFHKFLGFLWIPSVKSVFVWSKRCEGSGGDGKVRVPWRTFKCLTRDNVNCAA